MGKCRETYKSESVDGGYTTLSDSDNNDKYESTYEKGAYNIDNKEIYDEDILIKSTNNLK